MLKVSKSENELFLKIANESLYNIYVIDQENYELLYINEKKNNMVEGQKPRSKSSGGKCYEVIYGKTSPCDFCVFGDEINCNMEQDEIYEIDGRYATARFREMVWDGRPAYIKFVRDVTDEVVSRREKERLEQYFQTIVKYLPGGMAVVRYDKDGNMNPEYLSEGFAEMVNMPLEEAWALYEKDALAGVHPDDKRALQADLARCVAEKTERYETQYRLRTGDAGYAWINGKFSVVSSEGGEVRIYADYHDITQGKKMQEQLRQKYKERILAHYEMAGKDTLILGHCNVNQNIMYEALDYTNSNLIEKFGSKREDFVGGVASLIVDEEERRKFLSKFSNEAVKAAYDQGVREVESSCFIEFPSSQIGKYVQFKVVLLETPDTGEITGILSATDITEKTIRAKIFVELSSTNYDLVVNVNLFDDTYEIVSGGDDTIDEDRGCYSDRINKVIEETILDNTGEQGFVRKMFDPEKMLKKLQAEGSYTFSYSVRNAAKEVRTKNMIISAVDIRLGRVCFIRSDVTDVVVAELKAKERLEEALREAEEANQIKSDFLNSMSHDIRTPMNAIVGLTTLALANIDDRGKVEEYLRKLSASSQHLLNLINDILDMRLIEQSKIELKNKVMNVDGLIGNISSIMTTQADSVGVDFEIQKGDITHNDFLGDSLRIKQIIINLLSNAIKFTPAGGLVTFAIDEIPSLTKNSVRYRLVIEDTGMGMSETFLCHIFEPFIRSNKVAKVEGTGLGLSITKGLVDLMGGTIEVTSQLQVGSKFEIELEFDIPSEEDVIRVREKSLAKKNKAIDLSGYHFLIVEDNEINSEILGELLEMSGATFVVKRDGLQAVNEFRSKEPGTYDAILMDIQMPVMNGLKAAEAIRNLDHPEAKSIVIVAMTANAFAKDVEESYKAGMNGHVAKPIDMRVLYETVMSTTKRKR